MHVCRNRVVCECANVCKGVEAAGFLKVFPQRIKLSLPGGGAHSIPEKSQDMVRDAFSIYPVTIATVPAS